jgi:putative inorganic carbon (HCO3(-)) transporter
VPQTTSVFARYAVASAVLLTCVLFLPAAADPLNIVKLAALTLSALAILLWASARGMLTRRVVLSVAPPVVTAAALLVALVIATVSAPVTTTAILGAYGRNSGLIAFGAAVILYLTVVLAFEHRGLIVVMSALIAAGLFTAVYGQLQVFGIDPIAWKNPFNPIVATLGNSNFASAYMGVITPLATAGALWTGWPKLPRVVCGITAVLTLLVALQSSAVQGPIAAAAGLTVVALGVILNHRGSARIVALPIFFILAAGGAIMLAVGALLQAGPAAPVFSGIAYQARLWYWEAAIRMFNEHPVLGVGLSHYGEFWRTLRPAASVPGLGDESYSDSAHSVFLQMFAQGGLVLGVAYLAFVLTVGWALVRGLRNLTGEDRILLAGLGGAWFAFQMQSIVSIDQVPLIVLHFTLAGAVVVASGGVSKRIWFLPGAVEHSVPMRQRKQGSRKSRVMTLPERDPSTGDVVMIGLAGLIALVLAALALAPLRANIAIRTGDLQLIRGLGNDALASYEQAADLVPGMAFHWIKQGDLLRRVDQPGRALLAYQEAARRDPYAVAAFTAGGRAAEATSDLQVSRQLHQRAVELDPWDADILLAAANFELRHSGAAAARRLLEKAVIRLPGEAALWAALGDARAVLGDEDDALRAYETSLHLDPENMSALDGFIKLKT